MRKKNKISVLSYNIHKGLKPGGQSTMTNHLRESLHKLQADLVFLQEVVGQNNYLQGRFPDWPKLAQHDFFKSDFLAHSSYGKNAVYNDGHHGNAILSSLPFVSERNVDMSVFKFSSRGFLHTTVGLQGASSSVLHAICVHMGLVETERLRQTQAICAYIKEHIDPKAPILVAGDFNDWRSKLTPLFYEKLKLKEAFLEMQGSHVRSFPSWFPISRLDRIYFRNLELVSCDRLTGKPWSLLSDHLPITAEFTY